MTDLDETPTEPLDGRVARRQRNINAVLDVVLEMFAEDAMFPTMEQVATRSGLSLRSLYRYFARPSELVEAVITRNNEVAAELLHLPAIGEGPLERRIADMATARVGLYDAMAPVYRATSANAERQPRIARARANSRDQLRAQFEQQFAPELKVRKGAARRNVVAAGELLTNIDAIDYLRRHRDLSSAQTISVLTHSLQALLG